MPDTFNEARESEQSGPTRVRTTIARNLVVVVLEDTLLKAEKSLVSGGQGEAVTENRRSYQETMREDFVAVVEEVLGRKVIAFLSDHHIEPDIAVEMFVVDALDGAEM